MFTFSVHLSNLASIGMPMVVRSAKSWEIALTDRSRTDNGIAALRSCEICNILLKWTRRRRTATKAVSLFTAITCCKLCAVGQCNFHFFGGTYYMSVVSDMCLLLTACTSNIDARYPAVAPPVCWCLCCACCPYDGATGDESPVVVLSPIHLPSTPARLTTAMVWFLTCAVQSSLQCH